MNKNILAIICLLILFVLTGNLYAQQRYPSNHLTKKDIENNILVNIKTIQNRDIKTLIRLSPNIKKQCEREALQLPSFDQASYYNKCIVKLCNAVFDDNTDGSTTKYITNMVNWKILEIKSYIERTIMYVDPNRWDIYIEAEFKDKSISIYNREDGEYHYLKKGIIKCVYTFDIDSTQSFYVDYMDSLYRPIEWFPGDAQASSAPPPW